MASALHTPPCMVHVSSETRALPVSGELSHSTPSDNPRSLTNTNRTHALCKPPFVLRTPSEDLATALVVRDAVVPAPTALTPAVRDGGIGGAAGRECFGINMSRVSTWEVTDRVHDKEHASDTIAT